MDEDKLSGISLAIDFRMRNNFQRPFLIKYPTSNYGFQNLNNSQRSFEKRKGFIPMVKKNYNTLDIWKFICRLFEDDPFQKTSSRSKGHSPFRSPFLHLIFVFWLIGKYSAFYLLWDLGNMSEKFIFLQMGMKNAEKGRD